MTDLAQAAADNGEHERARALAAAAEQIARSITNPGSAGACPGPAMPGSNQRGAGRPPDEVNLGFDLDRLDLG